MFAMHHKIYMISFALLIVVGANGLLPVAIAGQPDRYPVTNLAVTKKKAYSLSNFSIGGVVVKTDSAQVIQKLGKPWSVKEFTGCVSTTTLEYEKTTIAIDLANWTFFTSNPKYRTDQGVRVGDSIGKVRRIYNPLISLTPNRKPGVLEYTETGKQNLQMDLRFSYRNAKVTRIEYAHFYNEDC
jgi:hypothetical protein